MIKRKYFMSVKVALNNDTGQYSWYNGIMVYRSFLPNPDEALRECRILCSTLLEKELFYRIVTPDQVEVLAFSRI